MTRNQQILDAVRSKIYFKDANPEHQQTIVKNLYLFFSRKVDDVVYDDVVKMIINKHSNMKFAEIRYAFELYKSDELNMARDLHYFSGGEILLLLRAYNVDTKHIREKAFTKIAPSVQMSYKRKTKEVQFDLKYIEQRFKYLLKRMKLYGELGIINEINEQDLDWLIVKHIIKPKEKKVKILRIEMLSFFEETCKHPRSIDDWFIDYRSYDEPTNYVPY